MRKANFLLLGIAAFVCSLSNLSAVTIYGTAYVQGGPATLYTVDPNSGAAMPIGLTGFDRVSAIDFNPLTGTLYGTGVMTGDATGAVQLFTINTMTGAGTAVGATGITSTFGTTSMFTDMSFRSDGTLFGIISNQVYRIDTTTGLATALPMVTGLNDAGNAIAFDPSDTLYQISTNQIATIDPMTGVGTLTGQTVDYPLTLIPARVNGMDYDVTTGILYASVVHGSGVTAAHFIAEIDVSNGDISTPRATITGLDALAVLPVGNGVPDNMSTLWLALPLLGLFAVRRFCHA